MEAAVRWSPHSTDDRRRFLVVDVTESSLTLNEVDDIRQKGFIDYRPVTRYSKLPNFSAFAWSPAQEPIVALGLVSGNAILIRLGEDKHASETVTTYKVKQQRKCNSVGFSTQGWLAVALDKTRSDVCLNIYDTNAESFGAAEPVRKLCAAELVSSVRFFPSQPQELIATTQRSFIRIYDLRDGYFGSGSSGNVQASTRNVNNVAIDPLDENYFASAGSTGDPSVTVWDKRWISQPSSSGSTSGAVFNFSPAVTISGPTSVWSLRYSGLCRGRLAICTGAGEMKLIDMREAQAASVQLSEYFPNNPYGGTPWHTNRYVAQSKTLVVPSHNGPNDEGHTARVIAFDWIDGYDPASAQKIIVLRDNREVETLEASAVDPEAEVTARNDMLVKHEDVSLTEAKAADSSTRAGAPYEAVNGIDAAEDFGPLEYDPEASVTIDGTGDELALLCDRDSPRVAKLLAPSTIQRERCKRGYLWDCQKNMSIAAGNWQLERLWEIVNRFREQAADNGMVNGSLDLSYMGVSGLWMETAGNFYRRSSLAKHESVGKTIVGLNNVKEIPAFEGERTSFPEHRQLCLAVCGWKFTTETLEAECQELIERGLYYQAIVQAVLHDYKHIALNLLRTLIRGKTIPNIGLGALLASDEINEEQREMCLWMAADTEDPALKALLTYLTSGDWRDVMKTNYLHLGYRVALGLKYLNDTELSGFIQTETARAVKNGDLEGILLTGLGEQAMDLFQTYITKTNDLQTAVLATAFTNPRYVDDLRWEMWKETYLMQMLSWRANNERTKFIVQHNRLARGSHGVSLIDQPYAHLALRCNHCQASLHRRNGQRGTTVSGVAANAGTVCLACGRHMPRCAICMLWLGAPDPASGGDAKALSKLEDKMAKFLSFCLSCGHGFHADHAKAWFEEHAICAMPDCKCLCGLS